MSLCKPGEGLEGGQMGGPCVSRLGMDLRGLAATAAAAPRQRPPGHLCSGVGLGTGIQEGISVLVGSLGLWGPDPVPPLSQVLPPLGGRASWEHVSTVIFLLDFCFPFNSMPRKICSVMHGFHFLHHRWFPEPRKSGADVQGG